MPMTPGSQTPVCGVPGCPRPRLVTDELCICEDGTCRLRHIQSECCKRHSGNAAGYTLWLRNDGIIDRQAIDSVIHDERIIQLTWVEALIATATLLALGYSMNETTRRLGFDAHVYRHGALRGRGVKHDLDRAVAAITGAPMPPLPVEQPPAPRKRRPYEEWTPEQKAADRIKRRERQRRAYARMTPEQREIRNAKNAARQREAYAARKHGEAS